LFFGSEIDTAVAAMQYCSITATEDLALDELWVVYPGKRTYPLGKNISVRPLKECLAARAA